MGTDIRIVIEFDIAPLSRWFEPEQKPFENWDDINSWDLKNDRHNKGVKDYRLFAALSGMRADEGDPEPLFEPRGLPENAQPGTRRIFEEEDDACGWLLAREVREAIAHLKVPPKHLSESTHILLQVLELLERRCGEDRVRIVFGYN